MHQPNESLPVRGAWIEMRFRTLYRYLMLSLPVRGAWIEITTGGVQMDKVTSLPVRGAWIEIISMVLTNMNNKVSPRAGSVD